jgi:GNAT superfamily N-acetyltransferase
MSRWSVRAVDAAELAARAAELAAFERAFTYPLGNDRFHIDHGVDYLAFFRGLGTPFAHLAERDGRIVGVLVAVRRQLDGRAVWYVCDLKVESTASGRDLARRLLRTWAATHVQATDAAFAVSMNAADGSNRLVQLAARCRVAGPIRTTRLMLFTADHATWTEIAPLLGGELGPLGFHDPRGTKDIVLASSGTVMPLLHLQHGPWARSVRVPARPGAVHMFCLPEAHGLVAGLGRAGVVPSSSATVLHRHLDGVDWVKLSTSDI